MFKDKSFKENIVYEKLLNDKLPANLGYLYENMVAQMLTANGDGLYYYTFRADNRSHLREIDFLITRGSKICPIEVKSSRIDRHVSLDEFCAKYSTTQSVHKRDRIPANFPKTEKSFAANQLLSTLPYRQNHTIFLRTKGSKYFLSPGCLQALLLFPLDVFKHGEHGPLF